MVYVAWSDTIAKLDDYAQNEGYDWLFAEAGSDTPRDYNVRSQAQWVGIGRDGAIVGSSAGGSGKDWPSILDQLSST